MVRVSVRLSRMFFFFQAEDGIRDGRVTGVQTCALPIFKVEAVNLVARDFRVLKIDGFDFDQCEIAFAVFRRAHLAGRSEERRVGKECRSRWSPYHEKKKMKRGYSGCKFMASAWHRATRW